MRHSYLVVLIGLLIFFSSCELKNTDDYVTNHQLSSYTTDIANEVIFESTKILQNMIILDQWINSSEEQRKAMVMLSKDDVRAIDDNAYSLFEAGDIFTDGNSIWDNGAEWFSTRVIICKDTDSDSTWIARSNPYNIGNTLTYHTTLKMKGSFLNIMNHWEVVTVGEVNDTGSISAQFSSKQPINLNWEIDKYSRRSFELMAYGTLELSVLEAGNKFDWCKMTFNGYHTMGIETRCTRI